MIRYTMIKALLEDVANHILDEYGRFLASLQRQAKSYFKTGAKLQHSKNKSEHLTKK